MIKPYATGLYFTGGQNVDKDVLLERLVNEAVQYKKEGFKALKVQLKINANQFLPPNTLWGTVRNGYRERPTLKMTPPTIVQNFGILEEFWRRKQGFISNWLRILSKSIWRGGKMGRGKWYLDTSDKNCCYMGFIRPRHKRFSSAVSSDT